MYQNVQARKTERTNRATKVCLWRWILVASLLCLHCVRCLQRPCVHGPDRLDAWTCSDTLPTLPQCLTGVCCRCVARCMHPRQPQSPSPGRPPAQ